MVILAAPVGAILQLLADLPRLHPGPAIVMDLGSTKTLIAEAMKALPDRFDPLGGHPMCGKENTTLRNAEAGLFQGAPFALTPSNGPPPERAPWPLSSSGLLALIQCGSTLPLTINGRPAQAIFLI
jgi:prephenate dehydrogenase